MYGMPLAQALVFLTCVIAFILATQWRPFHPFLVLVVLAPIFGYIAGYPTSQLGSAFGSGFAEKFYSPGLVIVAAALIAGLAESTTASDRLMAAIHRARSLGSGVIAAVLGPDRRPRRFARLRLCAAHAAASAHRRQKHRASERDTLSMALGDFGKPWACGAHAGADRGRSHHRRRLGSRRAVWPAARGPACGIRRCCLRDGRRLPAR